MANYQQARATLSGWKTDAGNYPFGGVNSQDGGDRVRELLLQASSLGAVLANAQVDGQTLARIGEDSAFSNLHPEMHGQALSAVRTLIDLAAFLLEGE